MRLAPAIEAAGCHLRVQQPIVVPPRDEPEPDISIVRGRVEDYFKRKPQPSEVVCVIEVSDSSLGKDRTTKLKVYASGAIPHYVIANLPDHTIESHTTPAKTSRRYRKRQTLRSTETLHLILGRIKSIAVPIRQLLP